MDEFDEEESIDTKYEIIEKIGSGGQANIFRVKKIGTDKEYAAKVFKEDSKYDSKYIDNEINMLQEVKQYQCPYIIKIIDSGEGKVIRKERNTKERKYFILEKLRNGCAFDFWHPKQSIKEIYCKIIFQKIFLGIQCLHKHNICHRDLKLENILFDEDFNPIISDFGYACFNSNDLEYNAGTKKFMPPEAKIGKYDGIKGDIFYLASALMIFRTGDLPFDRPDKDKDKNKKKDEDDIKFKYIIEENYELYWKEIENNLKIEDDLSPDFKDLLWKMVSYEPNKRITIDEMLAHPWFKEINDMKKDNPDEFKKKEEEIKDMFKSVIDQVNASLKLELDNDNIKSKEASYNRGVSDNKGIFNSNAEPKKVYAPMNIKYCINIIGILEPVKFMNRLYDEIKDEFILEYNINPDKKILKLEIEKDTKNDDESLTMEIKLYQDSEKYILRFKQKNGDIYKFFDIYKNISDKAIKLLNNKIY